jgi:hypothetical protein
MQVRAAVRTAAPPGTAEKKPMSLPNLASAQGPFSVRRLCEFAIIVG